MTGYDSMQVIRRGVSKLYLLPKIGATGPFDPWHVRIQLVDVGRDSDDILLDKEFTDHAICIGYAFGIFLR